MSRSDPIRERYYDAVDFADRVYGWLFYLGAALSIASLVIDKDISPLLFESALILFALDVVALFVLGLVLRFYLTPRAENKRLQDFFGSAWGLALTHEKTDGYYNNDFTEPVKRMAAQLLENSHFSKSIALRMSWHERAKVLIYGAVWLICVLNRRTDLGIVVAASQAVFSEQVLSRWVRVEWLRMRFEKVFDDVYSLFQARPSMSKFNAMTLLELSMYETAKSNAGIPLSSEIFQKMNAALSAEWESIKAALKI